MAKIPAEKRKADGTPKVAPRAKVARSEEERQQKFQAILDAAFEVFSAQGFATARLDDVARRAGVGKGTLYLYVASKEDLFIAVIRNSFSASFDGLEASVRSEPPPLELLMTMLFDWFEREIIGTKRRELLWLVLREARQFPEIARAHHQIVVSRVMGLIRLCAQRSLAAGEIRHDELARFPQLAVAPAMAAIMWLELFQDMEALDAKAMLDAYRALLMRGLKGEG